MFFITYSQANLIAFTYHFYKEKNLPLFFSRVCEIPVNFRKALLLNLIEPSLLTKVSWEGFVFIDLKVHADFTKRENKNRLLENRTLKFKYTTS